MHALLVCTSVANVTRLEHVAEIIKQEIDAGNQIAVVVSAMAGNTNELVGYTHSLCSHQATLEHDVVLAAGFQGITKENRITTLGRGGSDTTAVALAAALSADRCDIYTDVDGVYTADPRLVAKASKLSSITYEEMFEMAAQGAKVLQARSVELAMKHKGRDFLGVEVALLGGAMTWVSNRNLVSAISNAGGFGIIACGSMTPDLLRAEIEATKELTKNPFGVNLITMHPKLDELIDVCGEMKIGHVVLAGGLPSATSINSLKDYGCKVVGFAPALIIAKKLQKMGIDGLIIEGSEAGGHIGPVATSVLAQEILPEIKEIPVFVAGGIGRGEAIVSYLEMGAAGCQLGTRFAQARDAVVSLQLDPRFTVIPVRALANTATDRFMKVQAEVISRYDSGEIPLKEAQLLIEHFWAGSLRKAVIDGDVENGSLMAGQSVGMVTSEQTTQDDSLS
eukprot:gene14760-14889_t